jgi:FkbM family methyltransferase
MNRKIEVVIVCKDYSDYLEITLPINKIHFDNIVVVTSEDDLSTINLCKNLDVNCLIYPDFYKNNAKFNKGGAINFAIHNLKFKDWVVSLDSDIIMPNNFRELFDIDTRDINKFYGSYRRFIPSLKDYEYLKNGTKDKNEFEAIEGSGCGFWQCFNLNSIVAQSYGIANLYRDSYSAEQVDIDFMQLWCPAIGNDPNLVRTNIELLHLGCSDGRHHYGRNIIDNFFNESYDNKMENNLSTNTINVVKSTVNFQDQNLIFFYPENDTTAKGSAYGLAQNEYTKNLTNINFQKNDIIVDLGCNVGIVSMIIAKLYPFVKIYAFDPSPISIKCLQLGCIYNNITNIQSFEFGVGIKNEKNVKFYSTDNDISCLIEEKSMDPSDTKTKYSLLNLISIDEIFNNPLLNINKIKYMKVDIEAKEFELFDYLFEQKPEFLDRIDFLNVEVHPFSGSPKSEKLKTDLKNKFNNRIFF